MSGLRDQHGHPVIDERTFLAAHAPAEPAAWHTVTMSTPCPETRWRYTPDGTTFTSRIEADRYARARRQTTGYGDPIEDDNPDEREAWRSTLEKFRLTSWPWAWADAVLAAMVHVDRGITQGTTPRLGG